MAERRDIGTRMFPLDSHPPARSETSRVPDKSGRGVFVLAQELREGQEREIVKDRSFSATTDGQARTGKWSSAKSGKARGVQLLGQEERVLWGLKQQLLKDALDQDLMLTPLGRGIKGRGGTAPLRTIGGRKTGATAK